MMLRRFCTSIKVPYKYIPKCPAPTVDTGCTYCQYPDLGPGLQVDNERPIKNSTVGLYKHLVTLSGIKDHDSWPKRFEAAQGTAIADLNKLRREHTDGRHPVMVNMTSLEHETAPNTELFAIYPDGIQVEVPKDRQKDFVMAFTSGEEDPELRQSFKQEPLDRDYVLICGHTQRDLRCGKFAPIIREEFEKVLALNNIPQTQVEVGYMSHVGGHVYAANVLIFKRNGDVIWYGRVLPEDVQGIVSKTILGNEIIEEIYRGSATGGF